jgi:TANFOR domain-containing protein
MRKICIFLLVILPGILLLSQNDITISTIVFPPFSANLSSYVNSPNKILVTALNTSSSPKQIRFVLTMKGDNGISFSTNPNYKPGSPLILNPGQQKIFHSNNTELSDYFSSNNLQYYGIDKNTLIQTDVLPEGNYEICIQAFDYNSNQALSGESPAGCFTIPIHYVDPPVVIYPQCDMEIPALPMQSILFSWSPPATHPQGLKYEIEIKEIPITSNPLSGKSNNLNPNDVLKNQAFPSLYKNTIQVNTFNYTAAMPKLIQGRKYVWRVRAISTSNKATFKQNGYSEACVFTYGIPKPVADNNMITLVSPEDKFKFTEAIIKTSGGIVFDWKNIENSKGVYEVYIVKINDGQKPEEAIKKNPQAIIDEKGGKYKSPYLMKYYIKPGNYAWKVLYGNPMNPAEKAESDVRTFSIPQSDTGSLNKFTICNKEVFITKLTNKELNNFSGEGYVLYDPNNLVHANQNNYKKVAVKFDAIKINHTKFENGVKSEWKCYQGYVQGQFKDIKISLEPQGDLEGSFVYTPLSIGLQADIVPKYDAAKNIYKIEEGDKGEGCDSKIWAELEWTSPISIKEGSTYGSSAIPLNKGGNGPFDANFTLFKKKITAYHNQGFALDQDAKLVLADPEGIVLKLNKGSYFSVTGNKVTANLSGEYSVPNGKSWLGVPFFHEFQFTYATGMLIKGYTANGTKYKMNWDKKGKISSEISESFLKLGLSKPYEANTTKRGVYIYPNFKVEYLPGKFYDFAITYLYNTGKGYEISKNKPVEVTISKFLAKTDKLKIQIYNSKLAVLDLKGKLQVPFVNMQAPFSLWADYENPPKFNIFFDLDSKATVIDNIQQKVEVKPSTAEMINEECIQMSGSFDFIDKSNGNGAGNSQTFAAKGAYMKDLLIYADGTVKKNFISYFSWQPTGYYNGFDYKLTKYKVRTENGKPIIQLWGDIVLEENTLAPKKPLEINIAMNLPQGEMNPNYNPFEKDESKKLLVCNESLLYNEYGAEPDGPSGNNSLDISSNGVEASFCDKNTACFDAKFKYLNDDIYGKGFHAEVNAELYQPMQGSVFFKTMVGKAPGGYKYWFLEAAQKDFIEFPTGVLDLSVYGFGGRLYYHMYHKPGEKNIDKSDYVPAGHIGFGVYALANLKTKASNGKVLWGNLSTEITTTSDWGLLPIKIHGDAWILSDGVDDKNARIKGTADVEIAVCSPQYLHGIVTADFNYEDRIKGHGFLDLHLGNDDWHVHLGTPQNQVWVNVPDLDKDYYGHLMIDKLQGFNFKLATGVKGSLFDFDKSKKKCFGKWKFKCCFTAGAHFKLDGAINAEAYIPNFQLNGNVSVNASAGVHASACGIGMSPNLNATFTGSFMMPSPFCIAGSLVLKTPSPLPDIDVSARFKSGDGVSLKGDCN